MLKFYLSFSINKFTGPLFILNKEKNQDDSYFMVTHFGLTFCSFSYRHIWYVQAME